MTQQVIITVQGSRLMVGVTEGLSVAQINLYLDLAKKQILESGQIDKRIALPTTEQIGDLLTVRADNNGG